MQRIERSVIYMEKWALITGASSGIGAELAKLYASRGYNIALTARRADRLADLAMKLPAKTRILVHDLADREECEALYDDVSDLNIELLVNCAGFGAVGKFETLDLDRQIQMTDINCVAPLILTHMFLKDFKYRDKGAILNVASSAGLLPGGPDSSPAAGPRHRGRAARRRKQREDSRPLPRPRRHRVQRRGGREILA